MQEACFRPPPSKASSASQKWTHTLWILSATSCHLDPTQLLSGHHQLIVVMLLSCTVQSWLTLFPSTVVLVSWRILPRVSVSAGGVGAPSSQPWGNADPRVKLGCCCCYWRDLSLSPSTCPLTVLTRHRGSTHEMGLTRSLLLLPSAARCTPAQPCTADCW